jgi:hypothetical protein
MQMRARFNMNNEPAAASFHVLGSHVVGREHHEVCFKGERGVFASSSNDIGPKSEVGNKLAIHDIPLDEVDAGRFKVAYGFAEFSEVGGKN